MKELSKELYQHLLRGTVIPAHPLALDQDRSIDERRQRQLTRYYIASGVGGIAVGVHSTQFEIRDPRHNLYETVLKWASEEIDGAIPDRPFLKIAGICGKTRQAVSEAKMALGYGYELGLLSMGGLQGWTEKELLDRVRQVAAVIPVFGFYLQPSVGGRVFSYGFWRQFAEINNVVAIKCASFNRYQTLDVMRAVCNSSRVDDIAMYTGNDDNIVADLLTDYKFTVSGKLVEKGFVGGLLGHWAVWTQKAVSLLEEVRHCKAQGSGEDWARLLSKGVAVTDVNAAMFDPSHQFHGCIPGMHTMLKHQGLLGTTHCLNPDERLSAGQLEEIQRVHQDYPALNDDSFVREFLLNDKF
ncbi:dihydrodipicolinate synthase family protein [Algoriphagus resistens]|uniref:dihydrodipicolinate synthase family protein n=1 Tax=Algoriphagus resistens TaxID=1750590 RepID=UPI00071679AD|nr:dihydrodipicolinate synthase family protein [Algoriphagus resistens]